jgi:solute carrier family 31 (copper transporter), member 1
MLWNWETINACFLSKSWQIHSRAGFAGLCIGVVFLVIFLEFLRRIAKAYDRHLIREHRKTATLAAMSSLALARAARTSSASTASGSLMPKEHENDLDLDLDPVPVLRVPAVVPFRPSVPQQAIRALLHTLQFATAYSIMLLAMYYNGYIIICIIVGAFIGSFIFQWERIGPR